MRKKIITIGLLTSISLSLSGCIFVAGAAAGAAAIAVVYDHRGIQNTLEDNHIANQIIDRTRVVPALKNDSHVEVTVFNHIVLLTGETPTADLRNQAEALTKSVPGVAKVYNQLTIQDPTSTLTRTSDSWITTKIKSQMLTTDALKSSSIKVVTEDGTVYLLGIVTHSQADIATDIARKVSGVQKVIKIFRYQQ